MPTGVDDAASSDPDLADVLGQPEAVAALEVAAAGGQHVAMVGRSGVGKTLLARPWLLRESGDRVVLGVAVPSRLALVTTAERTTPAQLGEGVLDASRDVEPPVGC